MNAQDAARLLQLVRQLEDPFRLPVVELDVQQLRVGAALDELEVGILEPPTRVARGAAALRPAARATARQRVPPTVEALAILLAQRDRRSVVIVEPDEPQPSLAAHAVAGAHGGSERPHKILRGKLGEIRGVHRRDTFAAGHGDVEQLLLNLERAARDRILHPPAL
eukprot:7278930-Prymnesium_polylepis.1